MREITYSPRTRQPAFATGCAAFDDYMCRAPALGKTPGNAYQYSRLIRAAKDTKDGLRTFNEGKLRQSDLELFTLPASVREAVMRETSDSRAILYEISHVAEKHKIIHGFILTRTEDDNFELVAKFVTRPADESKAVVATMADYVSNPPGTAWTVAEQIIPDTAIRLAEAVETESQDIRDLLVRFAVSIVNHADLLNPLDTWRIWTSASEMVSPSTSLVSPGGGQAGAEIFGALLDLEDPAEACTAMKRILDLLPGDREYGARTPKEILVQAMVTIAAHNQELSPEISRPTGR